MPKDWMPEDCKAKQQAANIQYPNRTAESRSDDNNGYFLECGGETPLCIGTSGGAWASLLSGAGRSWHILLRITA